MATPGKVRIIAGEWRGRKIDVIDSPGLRPSPDRVRETLFNWLQNDITAARCLDLFAGTGALGFEALSRGAKEVIFVEENLKLVNHLKQQANILNSEHHKIFHADALQWLQQQTDSFDIIFLDPPFGEGHIDKSCGLIKEQSLLRQGGMIYIEAEKNLSTPSDIEILKETQAGQVKSILGKLN